MSLASRVAELLSKSSTSAEREQSKFSLADDGLSTTQLPFPDVDIRGRKSRSDTMAQKEVEEEGRPPIFHVRPLGFNIVSPCSL